MSTGKGSRDWKPPAQALPKTASERAYKAPCAESAAPSGHHRERVLTSHHHTPDTFINNKVGTRRSAHTYAYNTGAKHLFNIFSGNAAEAYKRDMVKRYADFLYCF